MERYAVFFLIDLKRNLLQDGRRKEWWKYGEGKVGVTVGMRRASEGRIFKQR